jgi:hypothetical protein
LLCALNAQLFPNWPAMKMRRSFLAAVATLRGRVQQCVNMSNKRNIFADVSQSCQQRCVGYFNKPEWAWEYLRRNSDYVSAWQKARKTFEIITESATRKIVIAHKKRNPFEPWGCLFTDAPDVHACAATVFWDPARFRGTLSGVSLSPDKRVSSSCFDLDTLQCPIALLFTPGGRQHLLLLENGRRLQLAIDGADIRAPVHFLAHAVLDSNRVRTQTATIRCFNELISGNRLSSPHYLTDPPPPRLGFVVKALDGWLARKPHKDIAVTLFGPTRVRQDWYDPYEHLRNRVRKAIRMGKLLMDGGYLKLLK